MGIALESAYDVNHDLGGRLYGDREYEVATNTVYHEAEHPTPANCR